MAFRGQSIAGRNYVAACRSTCGHNHATPSPWFGRATFRKNVSEVPAEARGVSQRKRGESNRQQSETEEFPRNSAPYARWHFQPAIWERRASTIPPSSTVSYSLLRGVGESRRNSNLRTDCPGCVFRTYEKWVCSAGSIPFPPSPSFFSFSSGAPPPAEPVSLLSGREERIF